MKIKGGIIVPSKQRGVSEYSIRMAGWYLIARDAQELHLLDGARLTVCTPRHRIDYCPNGVVVVRDLEGAMLRTKKKASNMCFDFSALSKGRELAAFLTS
jgi:hypothetical protein